MSCESLRDFTTCAAAECLPELRCSPAQAGRLAGTAVFQANEPARMTASSVIGCSLALATLRHHLAGADDQTGSVGRRIELPLWSLHQSHLKEKPKWRTRSTMRL